MRKRKSLTALLAAAAFALGLVAGATPAAAAEKWTCYTYITVATSAAGKGMKKIVELVNQEAKGDLAIKFYLGKTLHIKATNITQAVGEGVVQMASDGFFLGNVTIGGVLRLPMLITNEEEWKKANEVMEPYLKRAFEKKGVVYLGSYRYPLQVAFGTRKLSSLADLKGRKMRVTSPEQAAFVKAYGGIPVTLSGGEVPTALQRGVVEGVFTASAGGAKKWSEMLPYNYRLGPNYFNSVIIANKEAFNKLSASAQSTLRAIVARMGPEITANFNVDEEVMKAKHAKQGMVITEAHPKEAKAAAEKMAPFWGKWAKGHGPEHQKALAEVRKALGK